MPIVIHPGAIPWLNAEIACRRKRLAALPGTPDPPGIRIWGEPYYEWEATRLAATFIAAGHGYTIAEQKRRPLGFTVTCFCGSPIIYSGRGLACELAIPWDGCCCNGCILDREPTGRPKIYCSEKCKARMRKAMNRARRRAEGKTTRAVDEIADAIAEIVVYPKPRN
jgi:hypothetical protein